ncbi:MAG: translation initiation factor 2, partial [Gemmobacter sp.]
MKPNFALQFLNDSISLLHRTARGWLEIGSTPIDAPDLADALGYLRRSALGLAPHGVATKLVIPEDQILYLQVSAPGPTDSHRDMQIRAALEGRTPYDIDDLVFDWSGDGPVVQVAVVARETLREAEAFAQEYRLNPASFVAIPDPARFDGEPWFGPSEHAANLLQEGEIVERDAEAINIVSRDPQHREPRHTAPPVAAPSEPIAEVPPVAEPAPVAEAPAPDPEPALTDEPALAFQIPAEQVEAEAAPVRSEPEPEPVAPEPLIDELPEPEAPEPEAPAPEPVKPEIPLPLVEP